MSGNNGLGDWDDLGGEEIGLGGGGDEDYSFADDLDAYGDLEGDDGGEPEMSVSDYGSSPWGPGSGFGHRPHSMAATDRNPLGNTEHEARATAEADARQETAQAYQAGDAVADTVYDRSSYERQPQHTFGNGIFDLRDQGFQSRAGNGIFDTRFALPDYIAAEPEVGVWESEVLDVNTGLPRVVQGNTSGVQLAREADGPDVYSPFRPPPYGTSTPVRTVPGVPTPRGAWFGNGLEEFGGTIASCLLRSAQQMPPQQRAKHVKKALDTLGPGYGQKAEQAVKKMQAAGHGPEVAIYVIARTVTHAAAKDLSDKARKKDRSPLLPRIDKLIKKTGLSGYREVVESAQRHVAPMLSVLGDADAEQQITAFFATPSGAQTAAMLGETPSSNGASTNGAPANGAGMSTVAKLALAAAIAAGGYYGYRWWKEQPG